MLVYLAFALALSINGATPPTSAPAGAQATAAANALTGDAVASSGAPQSAQIAEAHPQAAPGEAPDADGSGTEKVGAAPDGTGSGSAAAPDAAQQSSPTLALPQTGSAQSGSTPSGTTATGAAQLGSGDDSKNAGEQSGEDAAPIVQKEPKRILGFIPNFRSVGVGENPPPPTPKGAFMVATQNNFDYSAIIFVGLTSLLAEGTDAHSQLGKGLDGFGKYYWRRYADRIDGNYWTVFILPTILHEDERYYEMGKGSIWKRAAYAASRVAVTRSYEGGNTVNAADLLGHGIALGIATTYYTSEDRTWSAYATRFGYSLMRESLTNILREFWPDIASYLHLHRP